MARPARRCEAGTLRPATAATECKTTTLDAPAHASTLHASTLHASTLIGGVRVDAVTTVPAPRNEAVLDYAPGSPERSFLADRVKEMPRRMQSSG